MTPEPESLRPRAQDIQAKLSAFADLVEQSPHNLLSRSALRELRTRHIPEAQAFASMLPSNVARLLDIGSGGGLPGMVIAVVRDQAEVHLVESTRKKARFLEDASRNLGLNVVVHPERAEVLARGPLAGTFDAVTARAVAPLRTLIPLALPFLNATGALYAIKGERWADELADAQAVLGRVGAAVLATPDDQVHRTTPQPMIIVVGKTV